MAKTEVVNNMPADTKAVGQRPDVGKVRRGKTKARQKPAEKKAAPPTPATATITAIAHRAAVTPEMSLFERIAANPNISVEKLDALISAQERIKKINAETAFNEAFAKMQAGLPVVIKRGLIKVEGNVRSKYARYEDIVEKIRPVLSEHGFSIRHETKQLEGGMIEITGVLAHRDGHSVKDVFTTKADSGGKMNDIQRIGSAISYGKRYTLSSLVGIATAGEDDDGNATGARTSAKDRKPAPPAAGSDGKGEEVITDGQRKRLWTIIKNVGRPDTEVKMWLQVKYNIESTKKIPKKLYEEICKAIEAPGALPLPESDQAEAREPGSDDQ
jgi:hypothetical protein